MGAVLPDLLPAPAEGVGLMATGLDLGRGIELPAAGGRRRPGGLVGGRATAWREAIEVIVKTELGERLRLPDFGAGLGHFLFEPNTTATRRQIQDRITQSAHPLGATDRPRPGSGG